MKHIDAAPAPKGFYESLGIYHSIWQTLDILLDFALANYRKLQFTEALEKTKGVMFARKLRGLKDLAEVDDSSEKAERLEAISQLFNAKRSEITHSYLATSNTEVQFIYSGNKFGAKACVLRFTGPQFADHVADFALAAHRFQNALTVSSSRLSEFESFVTANATQGS